MARYLAQVVLAHRSALPEDAFVNTWWYHQDVAASAGERDDVMEAIRDFYIVNAAVTGESVSQYLAPCVSRGVDACTVKLYRHDLGPGFPPESELDFTLDASSDTIPLPSEVAVCLSFRGVAPFNARRRGRVYLGPLNVDVIENDVATDAAEVKGSFRDTIAEKALDLQGQLASIAAAGSDWIVYSRAGGTETPVTNGWIDTAFDIQRRRGEDPQNRQVWGI